jgi:hypothetical protein
MVQDIKAGHAGKVTTDNATTRVKATLVDLHDATLAMAYVKATLEQAILRQMCRVITGIDEKTGKKTRNDQTSNWKRDLSKAYNEAYESKVSRLSIKTIGKDDNRTVTVELSLIVEVSEVDKHVNAIERAYTAAGFNSIELETLTTSYKAKFAAHQDAVKFNREEAQRLADQADATAKAELLSRATVTATAYLEAQGKKATAANLDLVLPLFLQANG